MKLAVCSIILTLAFAQALAMPRQNKDIAEKCKEAVLIGQALISESEHILQVVNNIKHLGLESALEVDNSNVERRGFRSWFGGLFHTKDDDVDADLNDQATEVIGDSSNADSIGQQVLDSGNKVLQLVKNIKGQMNETVGYGLGVQKRIQRAVAALAKAAVDGVNTGQAIMFVNDKLTSALVDSVDQLNDTVQDSLVEIGAQFKEVGASVVEAGKELAGIVDSGLVIIGFLLDALDEVAAMGIKIMDGQSVFQKLGRNIFQLGRTVVKSGRSIASVVFRAARKISSAVLQGR